MGTVTVQGRDELGRLIDVTLTTAADVAPPGPETVTGGGGGVTVDNQTDPPAEVMTLIAPGATISGDEADLSNVLTIQQASVTLTNDQIKALPTTPVEVVAAPGEGKTLLFMAAFLRSDAQAAYTNIDPTCTLFVEDAHEGYNQSNNINESGVGAVSVLLGNGVSSVRLSSYGDSGTNTPPESQADHEDSALRLIAYNGAAGDFTGGNAANTLKVTVWYGVVDV